MRCPSCRSSDTRKATVWWQCLTCQTDWLEGDAQVETDAEIAVSYAAQAALNSWPRWPVLPMVRRGDHPTRLNAGLITADYPHILIAANLFEVDPAKLAIHQLSNDGKVFRDGEDITTVYTDVQALLDDGWEVD
jgi:hypothetical protein